MLRPPLEGAGAILRARMREGTVVLPGVYDPLTALSATRAGARGLYLSGAAVTNSSLGMPDIALITMEEMSRRAASVCQVAHVPVIADADTGYGDVWNVARAVIELERAGLAGIHLEDQLSPKRCGHLDGKELVAPEHMAQKLRAAIDHRRDSSFLLIARTDARGVEGLNGAIERARRYVDAGADVVFPEGLQSEEEFAAFRDALRVPLLANMTEFGKTPIIAVARFQELGYELVIFPVSAMRVALRAVDEFYADLLATGTQAQWLDRMRTRQELYELVEYAKYERRDATWAAGDPEG